MLFAMPVYAGRIPAIAAEALRQFRGQKTPAIAGKSFGRKIKTRKEPEFYYSK
ncbi:hypothetical protein LJC32_00745 [Oscillospiraceae bacterium OttesenSCG-928-F05]|nr:hypothetical protein [Oscillospiraceae bacterium OttesenSCG-928-F05]